MYGAGGIAAGWRFGARTVIRQRKASSLCHRPDGGFQTAIPSTSDERIGVDQVPDSDQPQMS